jgi:hypothetical protein
MTIDDWKLQFKHCKQTPRDARLGTSDTEFGQNSFQAAAAKKLLYGPNYHRTQGSRAGLEPFLVGSQVAAK